MSTENQTGFDFDDNLDDLLEHIEEGTADIEQAEKRYKDHLWALVCIVERRLIKQGLKSEDAYKLGCIIIAEIAHYQGGRSVYLPRGDKLKQELRNIHMFKLWTLKSWPIEKIHSQYCPDLNQIQVYKILREARQAHLKKIQPKLI